MLAGERYGDLAEGNRVRQVVVEAPRGRILDADGRVVVRNRAAWAVTVKPSELGDRRREVLGRLARLLGTTRAKLEARIADYSGSPLRGIPVAEDVPTGQLFHLTEHADRFPGVAPEVLALREYPAGAAAAHVLGYVGEISPDELKQRRFRGYAAGDIVGKAGVELTYDKWLRGRDGVQDLEVNAAGEVVRALGGRPPAPGRDLQLTLDLNLQVSVERALADGMRAARRLPDRQRGGTYPAPAATAVVLDPDDGALLALASLPQYDPRRFVGGISRRDFASYADHPGKPLLHRAVQSAYPPGSTWKPFTALAGLEAGTITPTSTYQLPRVVHHRQLHQAGLDAPGPRRGRPHRQPAAVLRRLLLQPGRPARRGRAGPGGAGREGRREDAGHRPGVRLRAPAGHRPALRGRGHGADPGVAQALLGAEQEDLLRRVQRPVPGAVPRRLALAGGRQPQRRHRPGRPPGVAAAARPRLRGAGQRRHHATGRTSAGRCSTRPAGGSSGGSSRGSPRWPRCRPAPWPPSARGWPRCRPGGRRRPAFAGFPLDRFPVAGKTGTADLPPQAPFAWFASYAPVGDPEYVVVVMVEQGGHGGESAAPVARAIYQKLFGLPVTPVAAGADRSG